MDPVRLAVTTPSREYTVAIENNAIDQLGPILDDVRAPERRFVVSSPLVWRLHGTRVARAIKGAEPILVPDGERHKQLSTVVRIYDALVRANADRASTLVTFGGGVIGDMAGFAAATYLRGIRSFTCRPRCSRRSTAPSAARWGQPPARQEHDGSFYQPQAVVIDPTVLRRCRGASSARGFTKSSNTASRRAPGSSIASRGIGQRFSRASRRR